MTKYLSILILGCAFGLGCALALRDKEPTYIHPASINDAKVLSYIKYGDHHCRYVGHRDAFVSLSIDGIPKKYGPYYQFRCEGIVGIQEVEGDGNEIPRE